MEIHVRQCKDQDAAFVHELRNYYILNSLANVNIRAREFDETLQWINDIKSKGYPFLIAEINGEPAGYGAYFSFRAADGYFCTAEETVYVHPDHFRKGVGTALLNELISLARQAGLKSLIASIVGGNGDSILSHEKVGFTVKSTLENIAYKNENYHDIIFMVKYID